LHCTSVIRVVESATIAASKLVNGQYGEVHRLHEGCGGTHH
jgi:hypothetical protein